MTDRPIIFSAPMVRALIAGRKTQTRRVIKPQPPARPEPNCHPSHEPRHEIPYLDAYCGEPRTPQNPRGMSRNWHWWQVDDRPGLVACRAPYAPGDRLYVREAWKPGAWRDDGRVAVDYRASPELINTPWITMPEGVDWGDLWCRWTDEIVSAGSIPDDDGMHHWEPGKSPMRWRSPIHMPRWASRLTLTVTEVRVQRLQEISEADAEAEGIERLKSGRGFYDPTVSKAAVHFGDWTSTARQGFCRLWNSLHGQDAWDANPFVCAITFTVRQGNID